MLHPRGEHLTEQRLFCPVENTPAFLPGLPAHLFKMKASLAVLLAVLLCVGRVSSLVCFYCDNAESNWGCLSTKTCGDNDKYCITKYFGGGLGENHKQSISKSCSTHCPKGGLDLGVMAFSIDCCEKSLCNMSGAISVKSSSLLLAVGTLASLLYIFGAKL